MEVTTVTPISSLEKLKCASCCNYLSYFPVRVCSNNQNICGRCTAPPDELVFRNIAFETLSQFLKFPCCFQNEGCTEELRPNKIPEHEKTCAFRTIRCPLKTPNGCEWKGPRPKALSHCQTAHNNLFLTEGATVLDLTSNSESHHMVEHQDCLLIFTKSFNCAGKVLQFEMYTTEIELRPTKFSGQLSVQCGGKSLSCDFATTTFDEVSLNELKLHSVMTGKGATVKIALLEAVVDPSRVVYADMLSVLKCFQCSEYAIPPIYHCVANSETLCSDCNTAHQPSCPACSRSSSTRSISLDKMADKLNYPCKYQSNGCTFISKPDRIKKHQSACELGVFECPIGEFEACPWRGMLRDLEAHVQNNHQELVTNSAQLAKQLLPQRMKCDIIRFSKQLFRLVCLRTPEDKYLWTVQVVGPCRDEYKFEIEIVDPQGKGRRLLVRQQCGAWTKRAELFKNGGGFCYFMKDQIKEFVREQVITFKVHIFV